ESSLDVLEKKLEREEQLRLEKTTIKQERIRRKDQLEFQLKGVEERLSAIKGTGRSKEIESLKERKVKFKDVLGKLTKVLNEESALAAQLAKARQNYAFAHENAAKLQGRRVGILERAAADHAVQKILELKKKMNGIYGTVAELGQVENKYAAALEVAAGSRLRSVVVDTEVTAQKCIEYLKEQKAGVATFLPLNKLKTRVVEEEVKTVLKDKAVHGLALDLVKYTPEFKSVFLYTVGSTVIVDDLNNVRRIGVGRARMVTLEGDLVEPSGAMIGGSRTQRQGIGFKEKEVEEHLEKAEQEREELQTLISHLEQKRIGLEVSITTLRQEKAAEEGEIVKLERTLNLDGIDVDGLEREKQSLSEENKKIEKEFSALQEEMEKREREIEALKEQKQKFKENARKSGMNAQLAVFEEQQSKLKEVMTEAITNIKSAEAQIQSVLLPEQERMEKILKDLNKESEAFLKESQELKEVTKKREQELQAKEQEEKKFFNNFRELALKRNKLNEKVQQKEMQSAREEEKKTGLEQRLNNIAVDRAKIAAEVETAQNEFNKYPNAKIRRGVSFDELKVKIAQNEKELQVIGNVNWRALEVYQQIEEEYKKLEDKTSKLKQEKGDVLAVLNEIETQKKEIFMRTYDHVVKRFKEIFSELSNKGEAHVELEDQENPFNGGMNIQVRLIGNKFLEMKSLSGGEKTMATLAFIFAIQEYSPSPFYLLDEVDAALDKRNSQLLSELIQKYAKKAQYIVISHNDTLINEAEYIYGVSMQEGVSKVVSLKV
ncbi:AAA family ATPase, partial [Candidatus Woesearchaeota archaeon]|nr:AAA family ATPase [Candidatus Woesearchaeota archaeon]